MNTETKTIGLSDLLTENADYMMVISQTPDKGWLGLVTPANAFDRGAEAVDDTLVFAQEDSFDAIVAAIPTAKFEVPK